MSRYSGSKSSSSQGSSQFWAGVLVGMVIGAGIAAVFTWYRMKSPSPYLKELPVAEPFKLPTMPERLPSSEPLADSDGKPRFEFYDMLTNMQGEKGYQFSRPVEPKPLKKKPAAKYVPQILQIGSFTAQSDAEKLKANLALVGAEAHIEAANIPNRGVYYRVRLGPYNSDTEMNKMRTFLKQNDISSTPMRVQ